MTKRIPLEEERDAVALETTLRIAWEEMDPETPNPDLQRLVNTVAKILDRVRSEQQNAANEAA